MFGLFLKNSEQTDKYDPDEITTEYPGEVLCADFTTYVSNRKVVEVTEPQVLNPHGHGKITFKHKGEVIEEYEGKFEVEFYHYIEKLTFPKRKITDDIEVYEGYFDMGKFIRKNN